LEQEIAILPLGTYSRLVIVFSAGSMAAWQHGSMAAWQHAVLTLNVKVDFSVLYL